MAPGALDLADVPVAGSIRFQDGEVFLLVTITTLEPAGATGGAALLALALSAALRRRERARRAAPRLG